VSSGIARPGITQGAYPERIERPRSGLERKLARLAEFVNPMKLDLASLEAFADQVEAERQRLCNESDAAHAARIALLRKALFKQGVDGDLAAPTFALISEQSRRVLGMEPYRVQIMAGYAMLRGMLIEMQTGEGKTLTATLPACCAALAGMPVHVVTVNDYLVERDAEQMRPLYEALGLKVGVVLDANTEFEARREAYQADITYVTNKQIAFDYLRDRLARGDDRSKMTLDLMSRSGANNPFALRGLCYAIIDEADSVLIDEAGTPLVLSRTVEDSDLESFCRDALDLSHRLEAETHFRVDGVSRRIELTADGSRELERHSAAMTGVWLAARRREELVVQALQARFLYQKDEEYLIRNQKIMLIDRNTGRVMPDRSWELGLHQMIEVKEGVELTGQRKTLARISYQKFYRRYLRRCGMTGTAREVRGELRRVYDLDTICIPTRRPVQRRARAPRVFAKAEEKWSMVEERIQALHAQGRPVLVATRSVCESESLSRRLEKMGLTHEVLNARQDHREAEIVAAAGQPGKVTIATNMAGRGTDIKLEDEVIEAGGLHVISTARGEARRIDRQLYGRCARQGNPGSYESVDSLEDDGIAARVPGWVRRMLAPYCQRPRSLGHGLAVRLILVAQRMNESQAERQRDSMTRDEDRLERALAFSGQTE